MTWLYRSTVMSSSTRSEPKRADPAHVVTSKVDEHDVLGELLRVLDELGLESPVLLLGRAAPACAGNRPRHDTTAEKLHHRLGGRPHDRDAPLPEEEHVRTGVHLAQHPVDVERLTAELEVEALRQHDLERVTGADVLLGNLDRLPVLLGAGAPPHL